MERGYCQKLASESSPIVKLLVRGNQVRQLLKPIRPAEPSTGRQTEAAFALKF
jgi:hypothetical protein